MSRVAAVDLGTNSTRLLVADVEDGQIREVLRLVRITRLGEGVDARRRLLPAAIARVRDCLDGYQREIERLGAQRRLAVATSAIRDAGNGERFLRGLADDYGFATRLLSGDEEARLTFRGVTAGRVLREGTLIADIGGGSTELVEGGPGGPGFQASLDLGCVRLTERFLASDPPSGPELRACAAEVRRLLAERVPEEVRRAVRAGIGVAGTVTTVAALDLGLVEYDPERVHGHRIAATAVGAQLRRLAALPVEERRAVPGLEPARAPVIVGGVAVLAELLAWFSLEEIEASERDILDGAALEAAELP